MNTILLDSSNSGYKTLTNPVYVLHYPFHCQGMRQKEIRCSTANQVSEMVINVVWDKMQDLFYKTLFPR